MSICGFLRTCLLAMLFSKDNNRDGSKIKFASMAKSKVAATKEPKATVPPKLEVMKTEKPKNRTMEV